MSRTCYRESPSRSAPNPKQWIGWTPSTTNISNKPIQSHNHNNKTTTNPNLATSLSQLENVLSAKHLERSETDAKLSSNKELKRFNRLPIVDKNGLLIFQLQDAQDQCDIDNLEPNGNILTVVNQSSPISIQTLLHLECARVGLMAHFPLGLRTALKNGCLASSPRTSSLNSLCVFLCSPEDDGHSLFAEMALRIQEQATYGKLTNDDMTLLTGMKEYVPYDYASFVHMLKNIKFLCQFIGGDHCMLAVAWNIALRHATQNECLYREEFVKHKISTQASWMIFTGASKYLCNPAPSAMQTNYVEHNSTSKSYATPLSSSNIPSEPLRGS